jgi:murein peptide amidase A
MSRSLKHLLTACLFAALLLGSAGCQLTLPTETPGQKDDPEHPQTPGVYLTHTPLPAVPNEAVPSQTPEVFTPAVPLTHTPGVETPEVFPSPTPGASYEVIGLSVEGRPLEVYTFGSGADQRLIIAGIHGGYEWNSAALAAELIAYLQDNPQAIPAGKTLSILPNLNPDGEARAHGPDGRANANGVDLNRNFPANWEKNYRRSGCWQERPMTAGLAPASEPETQAVIAFVAAHPALQAAISYHSAALGIFPGGLPPDQDSLNLAETLAAVSGYRYPPMDIGCIYTGEMVNWLAMQGIPSVDIELTNHRDTDFEINLKVLEAFLSWEPSNPANIE